MSKLIPNSGIMDIDAYIPGKFAVPPNVKLHKLSANESPLGPSELAKAAFVDLASQLEDYPDGSSLKLRAAIAKAHGINPDNILCSNGSDECLGLMAQCYLAPGDEAIYTEHGFLVYKIAILAAGATPVIASETEYTADVDAILGCITQKTRMIFLANPNNPTGTYIPMSEVRRLHAALPDNVILVLDAAYAEYVRRNDYESGIELVSSTQNVVMTRTFSKIHGLASLRIGWVYGPENIIATLNRVRGPFNVNAAAQAAAEAAISDRSTVEAAIVHNDKWLAWTSEQLIELGLKITPSVGNFILIHFSESQIAQGKGAAEADAYLTGRGYVLRRVVPYGLTNAIRMTIGSEEACRGVVTCLTEFLRA